MLKPQSIATGLLLTALVAFGPLSTDMYLPVLPGLVREFATDVGQVQLTLSVFLSGFALAQLFVGPLSDRYGRRPVLIGGLSLYIAATVACMLSASIEALIVARLFQAIGACSGSVLGRAVVRDVYGPNSAKILAYMGMAMASAPMVAPIIGGYMFSVFGWHSIFLLLALFGGVLLVIVWRSLQETNTHMNPNAIKLGHLWRNYQELLSHRRFIGYVLTNAFIFSGLFCFISGSSFVLIGFLGVAPKDFGLYFGIVVLGYITGTFLAGRLTQRFGVDPLILTGCLIALAAGVGMSGLAFFGPPSVTAIIAPMYVFMVGVGLVMPNAMAGAIGPYPHMAGAASALMGFLQMGIAAFVSFLIGQMDNGTQIPMTTGIALMGLLGTSIYLGVARRAN